VYSIFLLANILEIIHICAEITVTLFKSLLNINIYPSHVLAMTYLLEVTNKLRMGNLEVESYEFYYLY
jgi:hypothetical protein